MIYINTKCNDFPFVFILHELASHWKSTQVRGGAGRDVACICLVGSPAVATRKKMTKNSFVIRGSLIFHNWHFCRISVQIQPLKWEMVYKHIPPPPPPPTPQQLLRDGLPTTPSAWELSGGNCYQLKAIFVSKTNFFLLCRLKRHTRPTHFSRTLRVPIPRLTMY